MSSKPTFNFCQFPETKHCSEDGLLASGGDLSADMLLSAYSQGIFPWYSKGQPILWWSPSPRMVIYPSQIKINRSMRKVIKNKGFRFSCNRDFAQVISLCACERISKHDDPQSMDQEAEPDTWITDEMKDAYINLHRLGFAHSIEIWLDEELVGGLYGLIVGSVFFGESMFSRVSNASKAALIMLSRFLEQQQFSLIDCQVSNPHLSSLGAVEIERDEFEKHLELSKFGQNDPKFAEKFETFVSIDAIRKL